jgi:hypothetical protein
VVRRVWTEGHAAGRRAATQHGDQRRAEVE